MTGSTFCLRLRTAAVAIVNCKAQFPRLPSLAVAWDVGLVIVQPRQRATGDNETHLKVVKTEIKWCDCVSELAHQREQMYCVHSCCKEATAARGLETFVKPAACHCPGAGAKLNAT